MAHEKGDYSGLTGDDLARAVGKDDRLLYEWGGRHQPSEEEAEQAFADVVGLGERLAGEEEGEYRRSHGIEIERADVPFRYLEIFVPSEQGGTFRLLPLRHAPDGHETEAVVRLFTPDSRTAEHRELRVGFYHDKDAVDGDLVVSVNEEPWIAPGSMVVGTIDAVRYMPAHISPENFELVGKALAAVKREPPEEKKRKRKPIRHMLPKIARRIRQAN